MSLHLGRLSSRVRKDELERVFQRYGPCTVRLRDGYGFVVYDFPVNAEKALRVLRGKSICGEPISLSWSKIQPRSFSRFSSANNNRPQEMHHSRNSEIRDSFSNRRSGLKSRRDHRNGFSRKATDSEKLYSDNKIDEETRHDKQNVKENVEHDKGNLREDYPDEDDKGQTELIDDDRWEERVDVLSSEMNDTEECNRYDPNLEYGNKENDNKKDVDENLLERQSASSLTLRKSQDKIARDVNKRHHTIGRKVSSSMKHRRLVRNVDSRIEEETHRKARRKDYMEKKRSRDNKDPEQLHATKVKSVVSSTLHIDYTPSRSLSQPRSSRSVSKSDTLSRSRSLSSGTQSPSSRPEAPNLKSENNKSRERSRFCSPTSLSQSVSLGHPLSSSPKKTHSNQNDISIDAKFADPSVVLVEGDVGLHNSKLDNLQVEAITVEPVEVEDDAQEDRTQLNEKDNELKDISLEELENDQNIDNLVTGRISELDERANSKAFVLDNSSVDSAPIKKADQGLSLSSCPSNPMKISPEELSMALKYYGLGHPVEDKKDLPVDAYFGSARLWPWQVIYYRRHKKGPITQENYARRIVQNQEYGIVDKYVRSSTGWYEMSEENF